LKLKYVHNSRIDFDPALKDEAKILCSKISNNCNLKDAVAATHATKEVEAKVTGARAKVNSNMQQLKQ